MTDHISSSQNPKYRLFKSLLSGKGLKKAGQFLLSGEKVILEALQQKPKLFTLLLKTPEHPFSHENLKTLTMDKVLFSELDIFNTGFPLLLGNLPEFLKSQLERPPQGLEVLCALGDPANLGALTRSAEAFGVGKIILLKESTHPFHPKALRASSGSALRMTFEMGPSIKDLPLDNLYALDSGGQAIDQWDCPKNIRLLMGEEGSGLPHSLKDAQKISIRMAPQVESLNAVAATSIALYEYRRRHKI